MQYATASGREAVLEPELARRYYSKPPPNDDDDLDPNHERDMYNQHYYGTFDRWRNFTDDDALRGMGLQHRLYYTRKITRAIERHRCGGKLGCGVDEVHVYPDWDCPMQLHCPELPVFVQKGQVVMVY